MRQVILYTSIFIISIAAALYFNPYIYIISIALSLIAILDFFNPWNFSFGLNPLPIKKVYTEFGKFFISIKPQKNGTHYVYIYKDNIVCLNMISYFEYIDMEHLKININRILSNKYYDILSKRGDYKKIKIDIYKNWNGSTTPEINREKKLEELL